MYVCLYVYFLCAHTIPCMVLTFAMKKDQPNVSKETNPMDPMEYILYLNLNILIYRHELLCFPHA